MKGQFYSIISIVITIAIVIFISHYVYTQGGDSGIYENIVADQIHQVEKSVETDFGKAMVTSGKRALISGDDYVVMNGQPMVDAISGLKELMEHGTVEGNLSMLMVNNTLLNWTNKIISVPTNFNVNITFENLDVTEYDAFNLRASSTLNVSVSDELGIGRVDRKNIYYEKLIPIEGAEDPIFTLKTNGVVTRSVKLSPYNYRAKKLVSGGSNSSGSCSGNVTLNRSDCTSKILVSENVTGLSLGCFSGFIIEDSTNLSTDSDCYVTGNSSAVEIISQTIANTGYENVYIDDTTSDVWHLPIRREIDNKYYFSGLGPNFIKRLEGDISPSANGLETFVNLPEFQSHEIPIKADVISVAYIYFGNQDYIGYPIRGIQSWFRLNRTFSDRYGLTELCNGC